MNFFRTIISWASSAWNALFGAATNPLDALQQLWHFITSVHAALSWLFRAPLLSWLTNALKYLNSWHDGYIALRDALHRLAAWIWITDVVPVRNALARQIAQLRAWTLAQLLTLTFLVWRLYYASLAYTRALVSAEHKAMLQAVAREHAAMLAGDKATLATVQRQAASGYNTGRHDRTGLIGQLAGDLADREPALKAIIPKLVGYIIDLESIDNPLLRFAAQHLIAEVLKATGADHLMGDLLGALMGQLTAGGPPRDLAGVERDVSTRLNDLEAQWASFMHHGGPEVESAGDQWRALTSVLADAALLAFVAEAATEPAAWAAEVASTVGVAGDTALTGLVRLINGL